MRVESEASTFRPVTITIQTQEEMDHFNEVVRQGYVHNTGAVEDFAQALMDAIAPYKTN
jgi:hypothetical protein